MLSIFLYLWLLKYKRRSNYFWVSVSFPSVGVIRLLICARLHMVLFLLPVCPLYVACPRRFPQFSVFVICPFQKYILFCCFHLFVSLCKLNESSWFFFLLLLFVCLPLSRVVVLFLVYDYYCASLLGVLHFGGLCRVYMVWGLLSVVERLVVWSWGR